MTRFRPMSSNRFLISIGLLSIWLTLWPHLGTCKTPSDIELQAKAAVERYAALKAVSATALAIAGDNLDSQADAMREQMLKGASGHREKEASRKLVRSSVERSIDENFKSAVADIWEQFGLEKQKVERGDFQNEVDRRLGQNFSEERNRSLTANFDRVFANARKRAVDEQAKTLRAATYPSQAEAAVVDEQGWDSDAGKKTLAKIEESVSDAAKTVFEENQEQVIQLVKEVKDGVDGQRAAQLKRLDTTKMPEGPLSRELAQSTLEESLGQLLAEERAKPTAKVVYGELPSVRRKVELLSAKAESERFGQFLKDFKTEVDAKEVKRRMTADLGKFRLLEPTLTFFSEEFLLVAKKESIRAYAEHPVPKTDMSTFRTRLEAMLREAPSNNILLAALKQQLADPLKQVRDEIADAQLKEYFGAVAARTWVVPETSLKAFVDLDTGPRDFGECVRLENVSGPKQLPGRGILSETEVEMVKIVGELVGEGKRAWRMQLQIVNRLGEKIRVEMAAKARNGALGEKHQWIAQLTDRVVKGWASIRTETLWPNNAVLPENAENKYKALFDETHKRIAKEVNTYFEPPKVDIRPEVLDKLPSDLSKNNDHAQVGGGGGGGGDGVGQGDGRGGSNGGGGGGSGGMNCDLGGNEERTTETGAETKAKTSVETNALSAPWWLVAIGMLSGALIGYFFGKPGEQMREEQTSG